MPQFVRPMLPWLALLASVALWGVSFVFTKLLLPELPPVTIAWLRLAPALATLGLLMRHRRENLKIVKGDFWKLTLAAAFGTVLYLILENNGLRFTDASTASMLVASIPIFVLLIDSMLQRTRLSIFQLVAIAFSLTGVWLVLFNGVIPKTVSTSLLGNLLVMSAMVAWILFTFISRSLGSHYSGLKQTTLQSLIAWFLYLPFLAGDVGQWRPISFNAVLELVFLGVFCSGLAYVGFQYAINNLGAVIPSAFLNLVPMVTVFTALLVLHEVPGLAQMLGAALIIGSLATLSLNNKPKEPLSKLLQRIPPA